MKLIISNVSGIPIYEQIKQQVKAAILSGELKEDEALPSLRTLAKDLKISVITTMKAYELLEQQGLVTAVQGKGYYVNAQDSEMLREQHLRKVEEALQEAIRAAKRAGMKEKELIEMMTLLLKMEEQE